MNIHPRQWIFNPNNEYSGLTISYLQPIQPLPSHPVLMRQRVKLVINEPFPCRQFLQCAADVTLYLGQHCPTIFP